MCNELQAQQAFLILLSVRDLSNVYSTFEENINFAILCQEVPGIPIYARNTAIIHLPQRSDSISDFRTCIEQLN